MSLREAACLPPQDGEQDDGDGLFFPLQTVICGERGATVPSLCLLLSCPVAAGFVIHGQSLLVDATSSFIISRKV